MPAKSQKSKKSQKLKSNLLLPAKVLLLATVCFNNLAPGACANKLSEANNANTAKHASKAIQLTQMHVFFGLSQLTVSPLGLRLENKGTLKFTLVAKAPEWKVTIFRDDDKTFISESLPQLEQSGLVSGLVLAKKERFFDVKGRRTTFKFSGRDIVRVTAPAQTFKYMPLNGLPQQIERIAYAAYNVPTNGGIPIGYTRTLGARDYITGMRDQGKIEVSLDTSKIAEVSVNEKMFVPPAGYAPAKSVREVVAGASTRSKNADFKALFDPVR